MYEQNAIIENTQIAEKVNRYLIYAPLIASKRKAGQFVMVRVDEKAERIPLTIADADPQTGTITLVVQEVGFSTAKMARMQIGQKLEDLVGPLGLPTHIERFGRVVIVGGGIGIAPAHPIAQAMKRAENQVYTILGARHCGLIIMEEEMKKVSDELTVCTDDGSCGQKGLVTDVLEEHIQKKGKPDLVAAIGPLIMMKYVSLLTKKYAVPTMVSLNPIMVDGTGMCGGCRVTVGGKTKFACVEGPEFDGHLVDFEELMQRQGFYRQQEHESIRQFHDGCRMGAEMSKVSS